MRTFTKPELAEFIKSKLGYEQKHAELVADLIFKARKLGAKDLKPRKKKLFELHGKEKIREKLKRLKDKKIESPSWSKVASKMYEKEALEKITRKK